MHRTTTTRSLIALAGAVAGGGLALAVGSCGEDRGSVVVEGGSTVGTGTVATGPSTVPAGTVSTVPATTPPATGPGATGPGDTTPGDSP